MSNIIYVVLGVVGALIFYWYVLGRGSRVVASQLVELVKAGWRMVDVHTKDEYGAGHVPGAVLVDFYDPDFARNITKLDKLEKYVLYCKTGVRSRRAVRLMRIQGFANVCDVIGGYEAYKNLAHEQV